ncbi:MAG: HIT family protein [Saprospiraceae bacterium]|nr:HIT family protein [Saprospiraceae bacterium]
MNPFKNIPLNRIIAENNLFIIVRDIYPVSPGHTLIISKRDTTDYFSLNNDEKKQLINAIDIAKKKIEIEYNPDGYNIGMNCGETAGQTVMHFHCHVIPRYIGDMVNPRGGIRHCIKGKGYY